MKIIGKETQKKLDLQEKALTNSIQRLEAEAASQATKLKELEQQLAQQTQATATSKAEVAQLLKQIEASKKKLQSTAEELASAKADSDLLLEQLHQVQEELETVFLKEQASQSQLNAANAKLAEATAARDALAKEKDALAKDKATLTADKTVLTTDRDAKAKQLAEATAAKDVLAKEKDALAKDKAALTADKTALSTDRDAKAKQLAEATAAKDALAKEKDALAKDKDALAKEKVALQAEVTALSAQLTAQQRELKQENDLMLLQLHQVQEELEHYFLEHQKLQKAAQSHIQRWQRLEARLPNYLDYETITPVAVDSFSDTPTVDWLVTNCTQDGQVLPELKFVTCLVNGKVGLRIGEVELIPRALSIPSFRGISTTEWRKIRTAATAIEYFFATTQSAVGNAPDDFDPSFWKQSLLPLVADIRALPSVFRYTTVQLKRELINPDYEHLWLVFTDASYGRQTWPKFEMRLGAANIQPGKFSKFPKLEFPRIDGKTQPFDSWFEESWDDFGGKLELRFDLNKQLADLGVWTKLTQQDQALLLSFIALLPAAVEQLQTNKVAISRLWGDWASLVNGAIDTLRKLLAPKPAPVEPAALAVAEPPKKLAAPKAVAKKSAAKKAVPAKKAAPAKTAKKRG